MPLTDLNLDDRTFQQLYQELRRRIPAYTPEWTDHNDSDPGITMLQLFAWLAEIVIYRLNRVPDKNYIKFLELVGVQLQAPAPAQAELQFSLAKGPTMAPVGAGTQVQLGAASDGPPIVFETDADLMVHSLTLKAVQSFDGSQFTDYTSANAIDGAPGYPPLSNTPQNNAALYLGFDLPFPYDPVSQNTEHRITIHAGSGLIPSPVTGGGDPLAAVSPPVEAYWEYWNGSQWQQLQVNGDTTFALTKSGYITFLAPTDAQSQKFGLLTKPSDLPLYWIRYRIQNVLGPGYENTPILQGIVLNTVSATNSVTETNELVGAATGRPNQTFQLAKFPVLPLAEGQTGIISVNEDLTVGYQAWTEVEDFANSGPADQHYTLNHSTGAGSFGDGVHGKIPLLLSSDGSNTDGSATPNIIATSYKWGGGARGNAGANTITSLLASLPLIQSVTNAHPSFGGADEETVEAAQARTPNALRSRDRVVTTDDFEYLATATPGAHIKRAKAFPLLNPNFRLLRSASDGMPVAEVPIPGAVTVVVVPDSLLQKPIPTQGTLQLVANYLDQRRLLTCELFVAAPRYREVRIEVHVIADPTADLGNVEQGVLAQLLKFFHPLTGGEDGKGWPFGAAVDFSETYRQIFEVSGVARIDTSSIKTYLDQVLQPSCSNVLLAPDEIAFSTDHAVTASYS